MVPQHVWHCPVRTAPGDRYLTDAEWAEVARRIVNATGIAPDRDDKGCRWIAVRHADDHIHIMATTVREDGRRPRNKRDGQRAQAVCRKIEKELGLRQLNPGDGTAAPMPTSAEQAKAQRNGHQQTAKEWLLEQAQAVAAAVRDEQEYFSTLTALGIQIRYRIGPDSGDVLGYSLARPGDVNAQGDPVYFGGSKLSPDLSVNRLRERLAAQQPTVPERPRSSRTGGGRRRPPSSARSASPSPARTVPTRTRVVAIRTARCRPRPPRSVSSSTPPPSPHPPTPAPNYGPPQPRSTAPPDPRSAPNTSRPPPSARPPRNSSTPLAPARTAPQPRPCCPPPCSS
ncbi:relaxase/mobilization nuclease domain-containing protein [Kitasatospora gansuensis]